MPQYPASFPLVPLSSHLHIHKRGRVFFGIILCYILQTENPDSRSFPPSSFQFVISSSKTFFICAGVSTLTLLLLFSANTYPSSITLLLNSPKLSKQEKNDKQNCNTRYETATSQDTFYNLFKNFSYLFEF
mgnify:CR=1 FL=1